MDFFIIKYNKHPKKFHILLEKLFTTLIYLNKNFGFIHWDLHTGNLLINKITCTSFLLYDFDMSETNMFNNNEFIGRYNDTINGSINIQQIIEEMDIENKTYNEKKKIYGLATDLLTFYFGCKSKLQPKINIDYFTSPIIKKIAKKINKLNYNDNNYMFTNAVPSLCKKLVKIIE
jgi:thiamine kinase-like enzyme